MGMKNYRDLSTPANDYRAGFQFEFYCEVCSQNWRSPFKAYRTGQATALLGRLAFMFTGLYAAGRAGTALTDVGSGRAKQHALEEAQVEALKHFQQCPDCNKWVDETCFDANAEQCVECVKRVRGGGFASGNADQAAAAACPNCQTPSEGGRFCHECGFDMASTHKSCPNCGITLARQARFCTDCGHGF